jgi:ABC-type multidrug transport system fused ATPase/permease subunit
MKTLFSLIFKKRSHLALFFLTLFSMGFMTITSQLEVFSVGILTLKTPDIKGNQLLTMGYNLFNEFFDFSNDYRRFAFLLICVALLRALGLFFQRFCTRLLAIRVSADLRADYFDHLQSLPLSFFQKHHVGSLASRVVGDASLISESINSFLTNYIQTPFTVTSTLILCFYTSWQLTLVTFVGFPLIVFPVLFLARRIKRLSKKLQENQEKFTSVLIDFLSGIQTVKLFSMENFAAEKYAEQNEKMVELQKRSARYDVASRPIVHTIGMCFLGFSLLAGLYLFGLGVSEVIVYCGFLYIFYEPIKKFAEENGNIQKGLAAAERMMETLNTPPEIVDEEGAAPLEHFKEEIVFDRVSFSYGDNLVLNEVSFSVKKGEKVAIVGATGAGKSTVASLLPRLFDPEAGEIRIDGKSIKRYTQRSLREKLAFVPQKPFLFYDTIGKNISYGQSYRKDEIIKAARLAHAEEFIMPLPEQYDTLLAEGGKNLSGGQQQRLAIARALFKKAPILVLDEATSALDAISENSIQKALKTLRGSLTQIVIAHRLSTIEDSDKIIFLDHGVKIAEGTKDELLASCPPFLHMWSLLKA